MTGEDNTDEEKGPEEGADGDEATSPAPVTGSEAGQDPDPAGRVEAEEAPASDEPVEAAPAVPADEHPQAPPPTKAVVAEKRPTRRAAPRSTTRKAPASPAVKPPVTKAKEATPAAVVTPLRPTTLAIDVGGTGLKASVLDAEGKLVADRVRVLTPHPCSPKALVDALATLVAPLPSFDRVSVGFPGVVRKGIVLTAPHLVTRHGTPKSPVVPKLLADWSGFELETALSQRFGRPVRIANDADLQGLDVVSGSGLEFVVTLGTGVGTALLLDGRLAPHLELAHHPFRKGEEYDEQLGDATLRRIGFKKWHKRLEEAIGNFQRLINYDRLYIGGGNARLLVGHLDPSVTIVDNVAGILGGIKLWELPEH